MKLVTQERIRDIVNSDVDALHQIMDAVEKAEQLLSETKEVISVAESDHTITNSLHYLDEVRQQIMYMTEYCQTLERYCSMYTVYASPDVKAVISSDDSILNSAKADDVKEKDFDPDETLQFCEYCGAAAPMSAKVCKKCGREFAVWRQKKSVPVKSYPDLHKEPAKPDNRTVSDVPMRVVYAAPDMMAEKRETFTSTDRTKK